MKNKKWLSLLGITLVSASLSVGILPTVNNVSESTTTTVHADTQDTYATPKFAAQVLYYGQKVLKDKDAFGEVMHTFHTGYADTDVKSLALFKDNSTTTDNLDTHLTKKGTFIYKILTNTNTNIPIYTIKGNTVYIYDVSDAAGQSPDTTYQPIAAVSVNKLKRTADKAYVNKYAPRIEFLDVRNMSQKEQNDHMEQITMGHVVSDN